MALLVSAILTAAGEFGGFFAAVGAALFLTATVLAAVAGLVPDEGAEGPFGASGLTDLGFFFFLFVGRSLEGVSGESVASRARLVF